MVDQIGAIILAAGGSKRFGSPKQLFEWQGETLINRVINLAITNQLDPIIVVLGSEHEIIKKHIKNINKIWIVYNEDWLVGQSTSLIAGAKEIEKKNKPFLVLLCDQPQITDENIQGLINRYLETDCDLAITEIEGKLIPPVIFGPDCINDIKELQGDRGARSIIENHRYTTYKEDDKRLLLDIDTQEDIAKLNKLYNCA